MSDSTISDSSSEEGARAVTKAPAAAVAYRSPAAFLDEFVQVQRTDNVLDVSASFGYWSRLLAERVDGKVHIQNASEHRNYLFHVGFLDSCTDLLADKKYVSHWSPLEDPADSAEGEYDLIVQYMAYPHTDHTHTEDTTDYHPTTQESQERSRSLRAVLGALTPKTGRFLLVDSLPPGKGDTMLKPAHKNNLETEVEEAGFEIIKQTDALEFLMDDLKRTAWANPNGESDRRALLLRAKR
jgi:predicted methyltransferase